MKKIIALLLSLIMIASLAGCSSSSDSTTTTTTTTTTTQSTSSGDSTSTEPIKISVGVLAAMTALPVVDIVNTGLDIENGIEIELVTFTTGSPMNEAMASNQLDAACIGSAAVFGLANFNAKMIAELCNDSVAIDLVVRGDSDIAQNVGVNPDYPEMLGSAETVKGATVLCPAGTLSQYEVSIYLDALGLSLNDVEMVPMDYGPAYQAFLTGEGDILATRSPQSFTALDEGWVTATSLESMDSAVTAQLLVSDGAYNEKLEALAILVRLIHETNDKLNNDVDYTAALLCDWYTQCGQEIEPELAVQQMSSKPFYGVEDAQTREYGQSFTEILVPFMIDTDQLEADQSAVIFDNVKIEALQLAGLK